jgi:hypothetical protein
LYRMDAAMGRREGVRQIDAVVYCRGNGSPCWSVPNVGSLLDCSSDFAADALRAMAAMERVFDVGTAHQRSVPTWHRLKSLAQRHGKSGIVPA